MQEKGFILLLLTLLTVHIDNARGRQILSGCDTDSWYPYRYEKCVKVLDQMVTQVEATDVCRSFSAQLLQIDSAEEQEFLTQLIFETFQTLDNVWLGAVRNRFGNFVWTNGDELGSFTHWAEGSPSDDFEKNCTQLVSHLSITGQKDEVKAEDGRWNDVSCGKRNVIVCQKNQNFSMGEIEEELSELRENLTMLRSDHEVLYAAHHKLEEDLNDLLWPRSCEHIRQQNETKNVIYPFGRLGIGMSVQCDFETDGGSWTIIQRRSSGPLDEFDREWVAYEGGFGSVDSNYWLGLKAISALTETSHQQLRIDMEDWEGNRAYAQYNQFNVAPSSDAYRLSVGGFSGDAGDSLMEVHDGMGFTTRDRDHDGLIGGNCADIFHGAWWYRTCLTSNLNGYYYDNGTASNADGVSWDGWHDGYYSLKSVAMKIRDVRNR